MILLHPPLPLVGVSIVVERERQQNDSLADGYVLPDCQNDLPVRAQMHLALNMFCQYIHLWMYVVPAADL